MVHILGNKKSIINHYLAEIRDFEIQTDRMRFRRNLERVSELMAYEISQTLEYTASEIQTPLGTIDVPQLDDDIVIASIMRAGIPMHNGMLNIFDHADNAFIAAYRKYGRDDGFEIKLEYVSTPELEDKTLIICDPMLATGVSMEQTYLNLLKYGKPKHTHIATIISSKEGIDYMERKFSFKDITIWSAAVDTELTVKSYIVPGLGDAGDLAFGKKE